MAPLQQRARASGPRPRRRPLALVCSVAIVLSKAGCAGAFRAARPVQRTPSARYVVSKDTVESLTSDVMVGQAEADDSMAMASPMDTTDRPGVPLRHGRDVTLKEHSKAVGLKVEDLTSPLPVKVGPIPVPETREHQPLPSALQPLSNAGTLDFAPESFMIAADVPFEEKMSRLWEHFSARPWALASRMSQILFMFAMTAYTWKAEEKPDKQGGESAPANAFTGQADSEAAAAEFGANEKRARILRENVSKLGVVFVKLAQTLATRPDIVGDEVAAALAVLQDSNKPFDSDEAMRILEDGLGARAEDLFDEFPDSPTAAASMAQVYKAKTKSGVDVAVKVRRPDVAALVAADVCCIRLLLKMVRAAGLLSEEADIQDMTAEISAGLMRELDFRQEGANAILFAHNHANQNGLRIPRPIPEMTSRTVLTLEWISGTKLPLLEGNEKRRAVQIALDACFAQLLTTGVVHADPHHGNMLYQPIENETLGPGKGVVAPGSEDWAGWLTLIDFGLVTKVNDEQMEAMASAILHCLQEDWGAFLKDMKVLGLVPTRPAVWVDKRTGERASGLVPGVWKEVSQQEFLSAFEEHLNSTRRFDENGNKRRRSFSEMTTDLSMLSLSYRFVLPSWMIFVIRSIVTLDGFAQTLDPPLNAMEAAAPHALRRALTPSTNSGKEALLGLLLDERGNFQWDFFQDLVRSAGVADRQDDAPKEETATVLPEWYDDPSGVKGFGSEMLHTMLSKPEGEAMRRVLYNANAPLIARCVAARLFRLARQGLPRTQRRALLSAVFTSPRRLFTGSRQAREQCVASAADMAPSASEALAVDAFDGDWTLEPKVASTFTQLKAPAPAVEGAPSWRAKRVKSLMIRKQLARTFSSVTNVLSASSLVAAGLFLVIDSLRAELFDQLKALSRRFAKFFSRQMLRFAAFCRTPFPRKVVIPNAAATV
eukprot:scaffold788_cov231-Pinguiococcus_pyrenoidosus.AAC.14